MNPLLFGSAAKRTVSPKRPVVCSDRGEIIVQGTGEPTYGVCDRCRKLRGIEAMRLRRNINHAFDPESGYRRRRKKT